jgi:hypothetical protein
MSINVPKLQSPNKVGRLLERVNLFIFEFLHSTGTAQ